MQEAGRERPGAVGSCVLKYPTKAGPTTPRLLPIRGLVAVPMEWVAVCYFLHVVVPSEWMNFAATLTVSSTLADTERQASTLGA